MKRSPSGVDATVRISGLSLQNGNALDTVDNRDGGAILNFEALVLEVVILDNNRAFLNGNPMTGKTSGSTGTPILYSWNPEKKRMQQRDNRIHINEWLGGLLPRSRIVRESAQKGPDVLDISATIGVSPAGTKWNWRSGYSSAGATPLLTKAPASQTVEVKGPVLKRR